MAKVRALTALFHNGFLLKAGEIFEYADEAAAKLTGDIAEGMELVTKKTTSAFVKAQAEARKALEDTAASLRAHYEKLRAELEANPTRGDLVQLVLDAEAAAHEAELKIESDLV
jgi:hypothetical protein